MSVPLLALLVLQANSAIAHTSLTLGCRTRDGVKERFALMFGPEDETNGTVCKHGLAFPEGGSPPKVSGLITPHVLGMRLSIQNH